jgi:hypothetical protein
LGLSFVVAGVATTGSELLVRWFIHWESNESFLGFYTVGFTLVVSYARIIFAAVDAEKENGAEWLKECRIWMYRGAWAEWEIENIEMAVPFSPEELREKRNSILKHQSQMESAPFLGNDERLFWQRSEDRNRGTASLYNQLGLACYEAMEAFVEYKPL